MGKETLDQIKDLNVNVKNPEVSRKKKGLHFQTEGKEIAYFPKL